MVSSPLPSEDILTPTCNNPGHKLREAERQIGVSRHLGSRLNGSPSYIRLAGLALAVLACAPSAPELRVLGSVPASTERSIFVVAARENERVIASLGTAGFQVVDNRLKAAYVLRATIGTDQSSAPCGALHNVKYQLSAEDRPVLELKAKGWTGECEPNALDALSKRLAAALLDSSNVSPP